MNEIVLYVIVFMVGGMLGIMGMSLISANRYANMNSEIHDLRHQRKLLKDELIRKLPSNQNHVDIAKMLNKQEVLNVRFK